MDPRLECHIIVPRLEEEIIEIATSGQASRAAALMSEKEKEFGHHLAISLFQQKIKPSNITSLPSYPLVKYENPGPDNSIEPELESPDPRGPYFYDTDDSSIVYDDHDELQTSLPTPHIKTEDDTPTPRLKSDGNPRSRFFKSRNDQQNRTRSPRSQSPLGVTESHDQSPSNHSSTPLFPTNGNTSSSSGNSISENTRITNSTSISKAIVVNDNSKMGKIVQKDVKKKPAVKASLSDMPKTENGTKSKAPKVVKEDTSDSDDLVDPLNDGSEDYYSSSSLESDDEKAKKRKVRKKEVKPRSPKKLNKKTIIISSDDDDDDDSPDILSELSPKKVENGPLLPINGLDDAIFDVIGEDELVPQPSSYKNTKTKKDKAGEKSGTGKKHSDGDKQESSNIVNGGASTSGDGDIKNSQKKPQGKKKSSLSESDTDISSFGTDDDAGSEFLLSDDDDDDSKPKKAMPKSKKEAALKRQAEKEKRSLPKKNKEKDKKNGSNTEVSGHDSEGSEIIRRRRKKPQKKGKDSDEGDEDSEAVEDRKKREKRDKAKGSKTKGRGRKRIKLLASSDEEKTDSDVELVSGDEDGDKKKTSPKKKPKKIITDEQLSKDSRAANKAEMERRKRIEERQKLYNQLETTETESTSDTSDKRVVLEYDMKKKQPLVEVHRDLAKCLKSHQIKGVKFLYESTIESVADLQKGRPGSGCILAHSMGLGKTLQVISFIHTILTNSKINEHLGNALVICPKNTVKNWVAEFNQWLFENNLADFFVHDFESVSTPRDRMEMMKKWHEDGGVLIIGITLFQKIVLQSRKDDETNKASNKKKKTVNSPFGRCVQECMIRPGPDIVIIDEGHLLKNENSQINRALTPMQTKRRVILTGTPLQNNLNEYFVMVDFVKPRLLGTKKEFNNRFANPITRGQHEDSSPFEVSVMKKRSHVLHKLLDGCVQRMDYSILAESLKPKKEYVLKVRLTETQIKLYRHYFENLAQGGRGGESIERSGNKGYLFKDWFIFQVISAHPYLLKTSCLRDIERQLEKEEEDFVVDDDYESDEPSPASNDVEDMEVDDENDGKGSTAPRRITRSNRGKETFEPDIAADGHWYKQYIPELPEEEMEKIIELGSKTKLLFEIMAASEKIGDKLIVFSQSLDTLDFIEDMLIQIDKVNFNRPNVDDGNELRNTWIKDSDYFRLDGSTSSEGRKKAIKKFNDPQNSRSRLFLISTRAGSLGINLVGANRCIIFDASWNPTYDVQAIFRIYRFGQVKPIYIYRFVTNGAMEERVYDRQIIKQALSCRVVDEQQIVRHFKEDEVAALYNFEPDPPHTKVPLVPTDRLLADLMTGEKTKHLIYDYHEHDSLLEDKPEEKLTDEERRLAWEEFEKEKEQQSMPRLLPSAPPQMMTAQQLILQHQMQQQLSQHGWNSMMTNIINNIVQRPLQQLPRVNGLTTSSATNAMLHPSHHTSSSSHQHTYTRVPSSKPIEQRTVEELDFPCLYDFCCKQVSTETPNRELVILQNALGFLDQHVKEVQHRAVSNPMNHPLLLQLQRDENILKAIRKEVESSLVQELKKQDALLSSNLQILPSSGGTTLS